MKKDIKRSGKVQKIKKVKSKVVVIMNFFYYQ